MSNAPLLVSSSAPLSRIVRAHDGGFVFEAERPEDFARVTLEIIRHPDEAKRRAVNAKAAVINDRLNWENTAEILLSLYQQLTINHAFEASSKRL